MVAELEITAEDMRVVVAAAKPAPLARSVFVLPCPCGRVHQVHERRGVLPCGRDYDVSDWGRN